MVIGKILGAAALGFFQMAQRIPTVVVKGLGDTLSNVAFPAYAELQGSADRVRGAYKQIGGFSAALLFPAAMGIIAVGHDFTRIFLGPKWMPMVPALIVLAATGIVTSMVRTGRPAFMGSGQPQIDKSTLKFARSCWCDQFRNLT